MRRLPFLLVAFLAIGIAPAHAFQGVNMRWTNCYGDGGTANRDFACNTNSGSNILVGTFELDAPILNVTSQRMGVDLIAAGATLPDWWKFKNAGSCRQNSLSASFTAAPTAVNCVDWSDGQGFGTIDSYVLGVRGPSSARIYMAQAVAPEFAFDLGVGTEYVSFNLAINNAKTVGSGACPGCNVSVCLTFTYLEVMTTSAPNDRVLSGPANGTNSFYATWQGAGVYGPFNFPCERAVPAKKQTWGAVKSLYR